MAKILVIDDERSIRNTLKEVLEYENHEIDVAADGPEGLEGVWNQSVIQFRINEMTLEDCSFHLSKIIRNLLLLLFPLYSPFQQHLPIH